MPYEKPIKETVMPVRGPYGIEEVIINRYKIALDNAREQVKFHFPASNAIWVMESSDNEALLEIQFNTTRNSKISLQQNAVLKGFDFSTSFLTNTAQSGKYVEVICFRISDSAKFNIENFAKSFDDISLVTPTNLNPISDITAVNGAATKLVDSKSTRKELILHNTSTTGKLRIGDADVGASKGTVLMPEQTLILTVTDTVYARNDTGGNIGVAICEINQ